MAGFPVKPDGTTDTARNETFIATPSFGVPGRPPAHPVRAVRKNPGRSHAIDVFPAAMKAALMEMVEKIQELQRKEQLKSGSTDSRIIVPGR
ncbi:MAG: hypothetical protein R2861_14085 [Desulfobacterales bacterium]